MPGPQIAYALATGVITPGVPGETLPAHWHMGLDETDLLDWIDIGDDLWDQIGPTASRGVATFRRFTDVRGITCDAADLSGEHDLPFNLIDHSGESLELVRYATRFKHLLINHNIRFTGNCAGHADAIGREHVERIIDR